jgi:FAD/FMN-containing dehydrogenase
MSKIAHYLQEHLLGEVTASPEVRKHFAEDASILRVAPALVVYPRNETDVRKTVRFSWQLAERGRLLPVTPRGGGSDTSGAAIGSGILLVFTAHMNRILTLDRKKEVVITEPGVSYDKLEQTLFTHGLFLPPYPASKHYATIGGGLANNAIGEKTVKYGTTADYVQRLRVVLANGEVIETGPINKRELNKKLGLATLEGQIYRGLDALLEDNADLLKREKTRLKARRNASGYNFFGIKKGSSFDLTSLFIGSQGTLGIITEATLEVVKHNPVTKLAMVSLDSLNDFQQALPRIMELKPSILDMINRGVVEQVTQLNPHHLAGLMGNPKAAIHLFVEFDSHKDGEQSKAIKQLKKIVDNADGLMQVAGTHDEQERLWKVRHSVSSLLATPQQQRKAVPVAEDVSVPVESLAEFLDKAAQIYAAAGLTAAAWGHAGDGIVRMHPNLDLGQLGDRQKLFKVADHIYRTAIEMGGSTSGAAGDGRVRAPYLRALYGDAMFELMMQVKKTFDPYGILNPGVMTASQEEVKALMRGDYSLSHRHEYLPRS